MAQKWAYRDGEWTDGSEVAALKEKGKGGWVSEAGSRFKSVAIVASTLPPNIYTFVPTDHGMYYEKQTFPTDDAVSLPGLPCELILEQMKTFWNSADRYKEYGMVHKRGVLLYGPPGSGKTCIVRLLCNVLLEIGGVIFSIDDFRKASSFTAEFRRCEPQRPIMTIQEDIEGIFIGKEGEEQVRAALSYLDGQDQTNNIIHVATSNQPELIADRFIKRPGRFDLVIGIGTPAEETRRAYLRHVFKDKLSEEKLNEIVEKTEGLGLAYLREVAASHLCLNVPLEETVVRLQDNRKTKTFENDKKFTGFKVGYDGTSKGR